MKNNETIYLDHQATTPVNARVLADMLPYFAESFGNPHSADHYVGWSSAQAVEEAAAHVAHLIGADSNEIIFTSGATESNNMALLGLGRRAVEGERKRILISTVEHKCVLSVAQVLKYELGYTVEFIPVDSEGHVVISALENALDDDVLVVSIMAVNNEIGTIQDISRISQVIQNSGAIFHCDAAQAPNAIDLHSISGFVDLLSLSSHKMYGPQGVGALFVQRLLHDQIEPLIYGGGQQGGLRSGTVPVPLCVGMGSAATICAAVEAGKARDEVRRQRDRFVDNLKLLPWPIVLNGPQGRNRHPGNANIRFDGFLAHDILGTLQPRLAASTGSACSSGSPESSHVLKAIGLASDEAEASIRFSIGLGTDDADLEEAVSLIDKALAGLAEVGQIRSG